MRKLKWFAAILVVASITFGTGCKQDTEIKYVEKEGEPLVITLTPSTTEKTNEDIVVNVSCETVGNIKKIAFKKGTIVKIDDVLSGTDITESKKITVTENATYTVAALDTAGRRELAFVTVKNIDKTAPNSVGNFDAGYSSSTNVITLSWTNPVSEDFAGTIITYGKIASEKKTTIECSKEATMKMIEYIVADDSEYTITIAPKDDVGNIGEEKSVVLKASKTPLVQNITLDRVHFDTIMQNRNINVIITGSNFDCLESLLVQVTDGTTAQPPVEASIDATNRATATVTAPVPDNATDEGIIYTIQPIIDGKKNTEVSSSFIVSNPATVTEITLSETQLQFGTAESVIATVIGKNFNIRGVTTIKLFDSIGKEVAESTTYVSSGTNISSTEFKATIPLPKESGIYTVAVFFDDVQESTKTTIQIYEAPTIARVIIPTAGKSYAGNPLPITIIGKNFTAPGVSSSSFMGDGAGIKKFVVVSDTKATAEITCPYSEGTTNITVTCGDSSNNGILTVLPAEKCFAIGDIILTDGSKVSVNDVTTYTIDENNKPIGVVASTAYGNGVGKAVGLQKSSSALEWAPEDTTGYNTVFTNIVCTPSQEGSGAALTATFTGDIDGSDNWEYICSIDPEGTRDPANNYPAFNFALTYGTQAGLTETDYENGWYVPSVAELCDVYTNKEVVQTSLNAAGGFTLGTSHYWSSSQHASYYFYNNVYPVNFDYGSVNCYGKNSQLNVFVLHAFNAEQFN